MLLVALTMFAFSTIATAQVEINKITIEYMNGKKSYYLGAELKKESYVFIFMTIHY